MTKHPSQKVLTFRHLLSCDTIGHIFNLAGRLSVEIDLNDSVNHTDYQMLSKAFEVLRNSSPKLPVEKNVLLLEKMTMLIFLEWINWQQYFYTPLFLICTSQNTE